MGAGNSSPPAHVAPGMPVVEIWSDLVCPWCGLGAHRLHTAIAQFDGDIQLINRSFRLDPMGLETESRPVMEMLVQDKEWTEDFAATETRRIEDLAAAEGLQPYVVAENTTGNTALAHELLAYATEQGQNNQLWSALLTAHFAREIDIFDTEALIAFAAQHGLDEAGAREALTSRRFRAQVEQDQMVAERLGATGVPFIVVDRRFGIAGAQPAETILEVLERTKAEA